MPHLWTMGECRMHSMGPAINYNYEVHPYTHVKYGVNVKSHDIVNAITAGLSYSFFRPSFCMHFHTKLNEMQRYVCVQQNSRIIASLWNCELLLLLSRTWKSCGHFYIYRRLLFEENERGLRSKPLQKKLVISLLAPCSQESVKFWYGLSIYFEKK